MDRYRDKILTDTKLLAAYQKDHDQKILGRLYEGYMELVFGLCLKYFKNKDDSEDAVISIYELISEKLKTQEVKSFKSWLYVVAKNYCLDKLRKDKKSLTKEKEIYRMQSESYFHPDEVESNEREFKILELCIEKLPSIQKKMIDLFYYKKKSYQEIVDQEQLEWNIVRSNIQNGRRNLKKCIEANV